jgi:hypothetical protein
MNRKRNKSKQLKVLKYFPTLLICILTLPANYSGKPLRLNVTSCDPKFLNTKCPISTVPSHTKTNNDFTNYPSDEKVTDKPTINEIFVLTSILILILATILTSIVLGYFYSVPIVKQSLLLFLYQDVCKLALLLNVTASVAIVTCYAYGNGLTIPPTPAKVVAYGLSNITLHLLLATNAHGFLHLYSMKEMVLDPTFPWVEDDRVAIKMMRFISLVFVTSVTSLLFAYEQYPKPYYTMIGDHMPITELPIGTNALSMLIGVLIVTYIITLLASVFYEQRSIYFGESATIPSGLRHLSSLFIFFGGLVLVFGAILNFMSDGKLWIMTLIFQILFGVLAQISIISTSSEIKGYVKGIFQASTLFLSDFYEQYFSRRSPQVYPIED